MTDLDALALEKHLLFKEEQDKKAKADYVHQFALD